MLNLGSLVATLGVDPSGLALATREMKKFEAQTKHSVDSINRRLKTTGTAMQKVGRSITRSITLPLTLAGVAAFKLAKDFEFSLSKITSLVGVASEQVMQWGRDIIDLAPKLAKAPKELADALFFVTSAGIRGAEALDVLTMSAEASAAGLGETKVVADLVTSAMNAYGSAVLSASMATDILVNTVRKGKVEADALTGSLGWVIPVSSALGVSFDQVGAAVASMTRTGTSARTASVQLRQILFSMLKPSDQARDALEAMGTSASRLRKKLREDGLISTLLELKNLQKEYGEETLATIFPNIRALAGVLDIVGANMKNNVEIFKSLENSTGLASDAFAIASDTVEFKWQQAIAQAKTSLTEFGKSLNEAFLPILKTLTERIKQLSDWFTSLSESQRRLVIGVGVFVAALGPLLTILGFLMTTIIPGLITAFAGLTAVIAANPIGALAIGLLAVISVLSNFTLGTDEATIAQEKLAESIVTVNKELGKQLFYDNIDKIKTFTREMDYAHNGVGNFAKVVKGFTKEELESLKWYLEDQIPRALRTLSNQMDGVRNITVESSLERMRKSLAEVNKELGLFKEIVDEDSTFNLVVKRAASPDKLDAIPSEGVSFPVDETALWIERLQLIGSMQVALGLLGKEYETFGGALEIAQRKQALLKTTIVSLLETGLDPTSQKIKDLVEDYDEAVKKTEELVEANKRAENSYIDLGSAVEQFVSNVVADFGEAIAGLITGTGDIGSFFSSIYSSLGSFLITIGEAMIAYGVGVEAFLAAFDNPVAAVILGAAVVVAGVVVRDLAAQGLATGGTVTDAGQFMVGERGPELVSLPNGAAVTSNRDLQRMGGRNNENEEIKWRIEGKDLVAILNLQTILNNSY